MDDGGMAQIADRALHGEVPHRDFEDPWTGGWTFAQAEVFRLFGASLAMLRVPVFVAWLVGLMAALRVARRFLDETLTALVVLACAIWSLYAWHLPLLNWFYTPLALLSCWAVMKFEESEHRGWLVLAGASVGVALLVKVTGLFLLSALLLWSLTRASDDAATPLRRASGFAAVAGVLLMAFVVSVLMLLRGLPPELFGSASLHFLLPSTVLSAWVFWEVLRGGRTASVGLRNLVALVAPLLVGVLVVLVPFIVHYARLHALDDLILGVFVRPRVRLLLVAYGPPGRLATLAALVPPVLLFGGVKFARFAGTRRELVTSAVLGMCWGAAAHLAVNGAADTVALSIRAVPILLPFLAWFTAGRDEARRVHGRKVLLLVGLAVTSQLVQVPFAGFPYFLFVAPLGVLATVAVLAQARGGARGVLVFWGAFLVVAGAWRPTTTYLIPRGGQWAVLPFERGGLKVSLLDSIRFSQLADVMRTRPPGPIVVIGDAPEVPFLLERRSAFRAIYDVVSDSAGRNPENLMRGISRDGVQTVVIRRNGGTRDSLARGQAEMLRQEFPVVRMLGPFEVRWRPPRSVDQP